MSKKPVLEALDEFSEKLSDTTRYMAFGLAGISFGLLTTQTPFSNAMRTSFASLLVLVAALACTAIFMDSIQLFVGYIRARVALQGQMDDVRPMRRQLVVFQEGLFVLKQLVVYAAALILIIGLGGQVVSTAQVASPIEGESTLAE